MIQIRKNVFETNSSSTHSLVVCTTDEWEKLKNNKLFIDIFAAEDGKTVLVTEDVLLDEAKKDYMTFDYDPNSQLRYHLTWDELYAEYVNSQEARDKRTLKTHDLNLFGTAGERYINPNSGVWHSHTISHLEDGLVQIDFEHFFG